MFEQIDILSWAGEKMFDPNARGQTRSALVEFSGVGDLQSRVQNSVYETFIGQQEELFS